MSLLLINLFFNPGTWTPVGSALGRSSLKSALGRLPILGWSKQIQEIRGEIFHFSSFYSPSLPFFLAVVTKQVFKLWNNIILAALERFSSSDLRSGVGSLWTPPTTFLPTLMCVLEHSEYFLSPRDCSPCGTCKMPGQGVLLGAILLELELCLLLQWSCNIFAGQGSVVVGRSWGFDLLVCTLGS